MRIRLAFCLILASNPVLASNFCTPDGSLINENVMKYFALHYEHPKVPLVDIKKQADNYNITYTKPACGPLPYGPEAETRPLPWDQLHVTIVPK